MYKSPQFHWKRAKHHAKLQRIISPQFHFPGTPLAQLAVGVRFLRNKYPQVTPTTTKSMVSRGNTDNPYFAATRFVEASEVGATIVASSPIAQKRCFIDITYIGFVTKYQNLAKLIQHDWLHGRNSL